MAAAERPAGAPPQSAVQRPPMGVVQGGARPAATGQQNNDAVETQKLLNEVTKRLVRSPQTVRPVVINWLRGILQGLRGGAGSPPGGAAPSPSAGPATPSGSPAPTILPPPGATAAPTGASAAPPVRR